MAEVTEVERPLHSGRPAYQAVIFDMDGVVTETALIHASAWKKLFDEVLPKLAPHQDAPFDEVADYRRYVDGRSREDGIRSFLELPQRHPPGRFSEGRGRPPDDPFTGSPQATLFRPGDCRRRCDRLSRRSCVYCVGFEKPRCRPRLSPRAVIAPKSWPPPE
jgi:hypothetical protein